METKKIKNFRRAKKSKDFFSITKDTLILDVVKQHPETAEAFFGIGMHCLGCPLSSSETN